MYEHVKDTKILVLNNITVLKNDNMRQVFEIYMDKGSLLLLFRSQSHNEM